MTSDEFADQSKRYLYFLKCEEVRLLIEDPSLVEAGRWHLESFMKDDPHQKDSYEIWSPLLEEPVAVIAQQLTERSERGNYMRETAPCFTVISEEVRARLMIKARVPLQD